MQDRSDEEVAAWKQNQVVAALTERGLEAPVRGVHTSRPASRRRAVFSGRRTKKTTQLGFHARGSDLLINIEECRVLSPEIVEALPALHRVVGMAATRRSVVRISATKSDCGLDVAVENAQDIDMRVEAELAEIAPNFARLAWNGDVVVQVSQPSHKLGTAHVVPPPGGFLQATIEGQGALTDVVLDATEGARSVVDLFAGAGTFALALAGRASVHAVEADAEALIALDKGWRSTPDLRAVSTETRNLFKRPLLPAELNKFDAIVLDPPRAGAAAQIDEIAACDVDQIAYVSCNPATFARDCHILNKAGYDIDYIDVIDQFRWSNHVEIAAKITRRK